MYLQMRRRVWYALHEIPADLREALGRPRFCKSLKTGDRDTARRRAAALEAQWLAEIARAKRTGGTDLDGDAEFWRCIYMSAPKERKPVVEDMIRNEAEEMAQLKAIGAGIFDYGPEFDEKTGDDTRRFIGIALGTLTKTTEHLDEYIGSLKNEGKTVAMKRATIAAFAEEFPHTADVTRKTVQRWVNSRFAAGKAAATVRRSLSELRGYWAYLRAVEVVPDDVAPFDKLVFPTGKDAAGLIRKPFTSSEITALHRAALKAGDTVLADVIEIGRWTGARIEEICAMPASKAAGGQLVIEDAKTAAGCRTVPVHPQLAPTIDRLCREVSDDGFLIPGLTPSKHGDRSSAVSKRFGRLKRAQGFGEEYVFHSIRHTVSTLLENAGVPENVSADILGHKKTTMTYGLYSGGCSLEVKAEALSKLAYPEA